MVLHVFFNRSRLRTRAQSTEQAENSQFGSVVVVMVVMMVVLVAVVLLIVYRQLA